MKTTVVATVRINTAGIGGGDMPGFLDMLRYDRPEVVSWSHEGPVYAVELRFHATYTPDRWASFGLYPKEVNR